LICCMAAVQAGAHYHATWDNPKTNDFSATRLTVTVDRYSTDPVTIDGQEFLNVRLDNGSFFAAEGFPNMPCISKAIIIPDDREMKVEVMSSEYVDSMVSGIAPSKGRIYKTRDPASIPYVFNEIYRRDAWYPQTIASIGEPFIHRDFRGCVVQVFPFQYNPVKKILRAYSKVSLKVSAAGSGSRNLFKRTQALAGVDEEFSQIYRQNFLNYPNTRYTILPEDGSMLIVCPSIFASVMQPFIDWKMRKGVKVAVVDPADVGSNAAALKTYIANAYNAAGGALKYVLLVGDSAYAPTPLMGRDVQPPGGGGADIIYGEIKGNDCYSELLIGRFSGTTAADIKTQVDRSIYYETNMKSTDTWLSNVLLSASNDETKNQWGETDADFINHEYDTLIKAGYKNVPRHNQSGAGGPGCVVGTVASVTSVINNGVSFWNYSDHGNKTSYSAVNFTNSSAASLSNTNKYFYTYAVACNTGQFCNYEKNDQPGDCLAEALMKAQKNGLPIGAVGCYMGSILQVWDPPYASVKEILEISLGRYPNNKKYTLGGVMINGGMAAYPVYSDQSSREVVESFVLFGDPNLQIYTTTPQSMAISHPAQIGTGLQTVKVTGSADGAAVCLYNKKESIQAVGTITGGVASIQVNPVTAGDSLSVTAMLFNHETYQGTIVMSGHGGTMRTAAKAFSNFDLRYSNGRLMYRIPENTSGGSAPVSLELFSLQGALSATLVHSAQSPGAYSIGLIKGVAPAKGAYIGVIRIGDFYKSVKVVAE